MLLSWNDKDVSNYVQCAPDEVLCLPIPALGYNRPDWKRLAEDYQRCKNLHKSKSSRLSLKKKTQIVNQVDQLKNLNLVVQPLRLRLRCAYYPQWDGKQLPTDHAGLRSIERCALLVHELQISLKQNRMVSKCQVSKMLLLLGHTSQTSETASVSITEVSCSTGEGNKYAGHSLANQSCFLANNVKWYETKRNQRQMMCELLDVVNRGSLHRIDLKHVTKQVYHGFV